MKNTTAFILILAAAGLLYVFILPEYSKIQSQRADQSQYQNILENVSELQAKRDELLVKYQNISGQQIGQLSKVLPDNVNTVSLAMNLDSIASRYGISIKSIQSIASTRGNSSTIVQGSPSTTYGSADFAFSFITTYSNFKHFMQDLEQSLRIIDVQSVQFQSTTNDLYEFQVTITTYWLK